MSLSSASRADGGTCNPVAAAFQQALAVGVGGFIGALARYGISGGVGRLFPANPFPWGTLVVNVVGCLLAGWVGGLAVSRGMLPVNLRLFLMVGLLGGLTTFSAFAFETLDLIRHHRPLLAGANVLVTVVLSLSAVVAGNQLAQELF